MKNSMRLVAKMKLWQSMIVVFLLLVLGLFVGFALALSQDAVVTKTSLALLWGFVLSLVGVLLSLELEQKYSTQRRDAWRRYVVSWGVPVNTLRDKMSGTPSSEDVYTIEQAHALVTSCLNLGVFLTPKQLSCIQVLEKAGWVYLAFADGDNKGVVARPTKQAWAMIDELCPRDWSPEEFESSRLASCVD
jgi:hypothetical protein